MPDLHEAYIRQREIDKEREREQVREFLKYKLRAVENPKGHAMPELGEKRFEHEYL